MVQATKQPVSIEEWLHARIAQEPTVCSLFIVVVISFVGPFLSSLLMGTGPPHPVTVLPMGCVTLWLWWHLIAIGTNNGFDWTRDRLPYWYVAKCPGVD